MSRYVVLYFEANEQAEKLIEDWTQNSALGTIMDTGTSILQGEIVALVPAPTVFCEGGHGVKKTTGGWFRGKKYGWWVCGVCGKPSKAWGKSYAAVISAGFNLLNNEQEDPPRGWSQEVNATSEEQQ